MQDNKKSDIQNSIGAGYLVFGEQKYRLCHINNATSGIWSKGGVGAILIAPSAGGCNRQAPEAALGLSNQPLEHLGSQRSVDRRCFHVKTA